MSEHAHKHDDKKAEAKTPSGPSFDKKPKMKAVGFERIYFKLLAPPTESFALS